MTEEKFIEIITSSNIKTYSWKEQTYCRVFAGLKIITKYLPDVGIEGADHDIVYTTSIADIVNAGITEEDAIELRKLNWILDPTEEGLAHYV